jgi:hypothetical protein
MCSGKSRAHLTKRRRDKGYKPYGRLLKREMCNIFARFLCYRWRLYAFRICRQTHKPPFFELVQIREERGLKGPNHGYGRVRVLDGNASFIN